MFLERIGKICLLHTRPFFFYLFVLTPILLSSTYLLLQYAHLEELQMRFAEACKKGRVALDRKSKKEHFLERYSEADPYFLDNNIESLLFLQKEKKELQALSLHPAMADKHLTEERLKFLDSPQNRLAFVEETIRTGLRAKETEERQRHPVEIDEEDLKKLLSLIEDVPIDSFSPLEKAPQIMIIDFRLEKKTTSFKTKVLELEMKLLTREFTK